MRKLNRQERVVEEVKLVLKPRFNKKQITKEDYKEIMRRAVPKVLLIIIILLKKKYYPIPIFRSVTVDPEKLIRLRSKD